jgi:hypothetical protein
MVQSFRIAELHRAVQGVLTSGRLGQPVFVRYHLACVVQPGNVVPKLAGVATMVSGWLDQVPERVLARGDPNSGQVALTVEFHEGATALVSISCVPSSPKGVELALLGNHGALYQETGDCSLEEDTQAYEADQGWRALIAKALRSGEPEAVDQEFRS